MPSNSTGTIAIYEDLVGASSFTFSPQLTGVRASKIPLNVGGPGTAGLSLFLPGDPSDGDSYEFADTDGSCGVNHILFLKPDPGGNATVGHLPFYAFLFPFQGGRATFDAEANNWVLDLNANGLFSVLSTFSGTGTSGGNVAPADLTGATTTPAILFAFELAPRGGGIFSLSLSLAFTLSAPDTVTISVQAASNVSSVSGGTLVGTNLFVESSSPVVVTSDPPVQRLTWAAEVPADATGKQTATWAGLVTLQSNDDNGAAIVVTIATAAGASITGMSLGADVHEIV